MNAGKLFFVELMLGWPNFQVIDLGEKAPDKVLHQLYVTLEKFKAAGDVFASEIEKRLRLIVSWLVHVYAYLYYRSYFYVP